MPSLGTLHGEGRVHERGYGGRLDESIELGGATPILNVESDVVNSEELELKLKNEG
jgi:hypothetical protein